jgi:exodeoxyribonuclease VII small subunit
MTETATELTFEAGYERLQNIAARLNQEQVPVSEMCALFAEGKGLESALTGFLDTQQAQVEAIERGEGVRAFRIVGAAASALTPAPTAAPAGDDIPF